MHLLYMRMIFLIIIFCMVACRQNNSVNVTKPVTTSTTIKPLLVDCSDYVQKKCVATKIFNDQALQSNKRHLVISRIIIDSLMPCWYGTPWDFNGCTTEPGKGSIACGYFVSTVLRDAGVQLNRIRLAQSPSGIIIHKLCTNIQLFCNQPLLSLVNYVKQNDPGLYIVGLDFHVGFIYFDGKEVYFIHSSYYGTKCVVKEKALASSALINSKYRKIGRVNFN